MRVRVASSVVVRRLAIVSVVAASFTAFACGGGDEDGDDFGGVEGASTTFVPVDPPPMPALPPGAGPHGLTPTAQPTSTATPDADPPPPDDAGGSGDADPPDGG